MKRLLVAARRNKTIIDSSDIDEAEDRVIAGPSKKDKTVSQKRNVNWLPIMRRSYHCLVSFVKMPVLFIKLLSYHAAVQAVI